MSRSLVITKVNKVQRGCVALVASGLVLTRGGQRELVRGAAGRTGFGVFGVDVRTNVYSWRKAGRKSVRPGSDGRSIPQSRTRPGQTRARQVRWQGRSGQVVLYYAGRGGGCDLGRGGGREDDDASQPGTSILCADKLRAGGRRGRRKGGPKRDKKTKGIRHQRLQMCGVERAGRSRRSKGQREG